MRTSFLFTMLFTALCLFASGCAEDEKTDTDTRSTAHGCAAATATDMTGQATVALDWNNPHASCIKVSTGTAVTWTGDFTAHPLAGGVSPNADAAAAISTSDQSGAAATVTFATAGDYPYFCTIHTGSMTGVVYVD